MVEEEPIQNEHYNRMKYPNLHIVLKTNRYFKIFWIEKKIKQKITP